MKAIIVREVYAVPLVVPVVAHGKLWQRRGECRGYKPPALGTYAVFCSKNASEMGVFNMERSLKVPLAVAERYKAAVRRTWAGKLVGFAKVTKVTDCTPTACEKAWLDPDEVDGYIWHVESFGPPHGGLVPPDIAPRFEECCIGCTTLKGDVLRRHRISSHVKVQNVQIPQRIRAMFPDLDLT